jgi:glycosyltransferase involved in cell wall biosynthesis
VKVLHLNQHLSWQGGIETYLLSLLPRLEAEGHAQIAAYAHGDGGLVERGYQIPELSETTRAARTSGYKVVSRLLAQERIEIAHLHNIFNMGAIKACLDHVPTVVTGHDFRYLCPASSFYYRATEEICQRTCGPGCFVTTVRKRCLTPRPVVAAGFYRRVKWMLSNAKRFSRIVAVSESVRERFISAGYPSQRCETLPYFCPVAPLPRSRAEPENPTILFLGRIRPIKGYRYFIEALGLLPANIRGIFVGDISPERVEELTQLAQQAKCADRLEFRPWADRDSVQKLMAETSVFVFPSVCPETLGIVGLEALASGVPVVASDVGGVREWLRHEETGLLVAPKDPRMLADAIRRILESPTRAQAMGSAGLALIREKFSPECHVSRLLEIYRESLDRGERTKESTLQAATSK